MNGRSVAARTGAAAQAAKSKCHLELGRLVVRELEHHQASTADLAVFAEQIGCSLRTLWYAADVYRLAARLDLSEQDVARVGWTKIAIVAAAGEEIATKRELVELCEDRTVTELRAATSGTPGVVKTIVFTLSKSQRTMLEAALLRFGARRSGPNETGRGRSQLLVVHLCNRLHSHHAGPCVIDLGALRVPA
jgi:hypothetical protein